MKIFDESGQELYVYILHTCSEYGCDSLVYSRKEIPKEELKQAVKKYEELLKEWYVARDAIYLQYKDKSSKEHEEAWSKICASAPCYEKILYERFGLKTFESLDNLEMNNHKEETQK